MIQSPNKKPEFSITSQIDGFLNSPDVCLENNFGLHPFLPQILIDTKLENQEIEIAIPERIVLGKRIELLALYALNSTPNFEVLGNNLQINESKITKGEIDFLIRDLKECSVFHIELVYKFYLLDENSSTHELSNWIGPNRKDSLSLKVSRLLNHQLPILKSELCRPLLKKLNIENQEIEQKVWFKAQLFTPFQGDIEWNLDINKKCRVGFWCRMRDFKTFATSKDSFYLPEKRNWMIDPNCNDTWFSLEEIQDQINDYMKIQRSPLCWMKDINGHVSKFFLVWW